MFYYNNFLDEQVSYDILKELDQIKDWNNFHRNNSHMKEFYGDFELLNIIRIKLHSKKFINWLEKEIQIEGLVVDPHGVGEGVSLMESGDLLDPHIDFNWNDRIKMYRAVNLLVYLGNSQGGEFQIWDEEKKNVIFEKEPKHNSAVIFKHSENNSHGVKPVKSGNRFAIRQFYYKSENICSNAHQSLYWYNPNKKMKTNSNV